MTDNENPLHMIAIIFVGGVAMGLLTLFLYLNREAQEPTVEFYTPPTVVTTTPLTLPSSQEVLESVGDGAGKVWADATSPEAKEKYDNIGESVSDGWNTMKDSFNRSVEDERQNQQNP